MPNEWCCIADIIPFNRAEEGWYIQYQGNNGLIYENVDCWNLMLEINVQAPISEKRWAALSARLLFACGEFGCSLCQFQGRWWLCRRYMTYRRALCAAESVLVNNALNEQLSLTNFLGGWLSPGKEIPTRPAESLVRNQWG